MRYGVESSKGQTRMEFFGYVCLSNVNDKRTYVCHAFSEEECTQMLERIVSERYSCN